MIEMQFANQARPQGVGTPVTVDITEVHPEATKVPVRELRAGMSIWSIWGKAYALDKVTHFKHGCRTYRSDGEVEWFDYRDPFDDTESLFTVGIPD